MGKIAFGHLSALLVVLLATLGGGMGTRCPVTLTGTIRLVGNAPFARLVLTPEHTDRPSQERDYLLLGPLQEELRQRYQGRLVTLEGTPCASPLPQFSNCFEPARIIAR